jgi:hypothetical protein
MGSARAALVALLPVCLSIAGCQVTWREPQIQPLNQGLVLPASLGSVCNQVRDGIGWMGGVVIDETVEPDACLFESSQIPLGTTGAPVQQLEEVAYVPQGSMRGGRYQITASARPTPTGDTRMRISTRIEGLDGNYQLLRSRGLIERTLIDRITDVLGVEPIPETATR